MTGTNAMNQLSKTINFKPETSENLESSGQVCQIIIPAQASVQRTYIVLGVARSGTSMVTGVLRELGIFMGDVQADNHEDPLFLTDEIESIQALILKRNRQYDCWGWKVLKTLFIMPQLLPFLRNPHFIILTRDPFDIARSMQKREGLAFDLCLRHIFMVYHHLQIFIEQCTDPLVIVSYNRAMANRDVFIQELTGFLGLHDLSKENFQRVRNFIDGTGYRPTSFDKSLVTYLEQAPIDPYSADMLKEIYQCTQQVLQRCDIEIAAIETLKNQITFDKLPSDAVLQTWCKQAEQLPLLKQLVETLRTQVVTSPRQDIVSAEQYRKKCETLLKKLVTIQRLGNRLIYFANQTHY